MKFFSRTILCAILLGVASPVFAMSSFTSAVKTLWRYRGLTSLVTLATGAAASVYARNLNNALWITDDKGNILKKADALIPRLEDKSTVETLDQKNVLYWRLKTLPSAQLKVLDEKTIFDYLKDDFQAEYDECKANLRCFVDKIKAKIATAKGELNTHIKDVKEGLRKSRLKYWLGKISPFNIGYVSTKIDEKVNALLPKDHKYSDLTAAQEAELLNYTNDGFTNWYKHPVDFLKRRLATPQEGKASRIYLQLMCLYARLNLIEEKLDGYLKSRQVSKNK